MGMKKEVDGIILKAVERDPYCAIIGSRENFAKHFFKEKKRSRSSSLSSENNEEPFPQKKKQRINIEASDDPETYDNMNIKNHYDLSTPSSHSPSRTPTVQECRVQISLEDHIRANKVLREMELSALIKPCSVVIRRTSIKTEAIAGPKRRCKASGSRRSTKSKPKNQQPSSMKPVPKSKQMQVKKVKKEEDKLFFCLDCECCPSSKCSHYNHTRRLIESKEQHITNYAHGRFQSVDQFLRKTVKINLNDVAYDKEHGQTIRKQYKKYVASIWSAPKSGPHLFEYPKIKQCKYCSYQIANIVYMFRHIRAEHLGD